MHIYKVILAGNFRYFREDVLSAEQLHTQYINIIVHEQAPSFFPPFLQKQEITFRDCVFVFLEMEAIFK